MDELRAMLKKTTQDMDACNLRIQSLASDNVQLRSKVAKLEHEVKVLRNFVGGPASALNPCAGSGRSAAEGSSSTVSGHKRSRDLLSYGEGDDSEVEDESVHVAQPTARGHSVGAGLGLPFAATAGAGSSSSSPELRSANVPSHAPLHQGMHHLLAEADAEEEDDGLVEVSSDDGEGRSWDTQPLTGEAVPSATSSTAASALASPPVDTAAVLSACKLQRGDLAWYLDPKTEKYWLAKVISSSVVETRSGGYVIKHRIVFKGGEMGQTCEDDLLITLPWLRQLTEQNNHPAMNEEWTLTEKGRKNEAKGWPQRGGKRGGKAAKK